ncbi:MAG TPA: GGDEF domain-containing protein [Gemmatimonadota bacterium]|nr:GGDEF domain-containing protein [Gemmatimonadota bacterium]
MNMLSTAPMGSRSRVGRIASALVLTLGLGVLDIVTGPDLSFSIFYVLPLALVSWYGDRWEGAALAVICAIVWLAADRLAGAAYSNPIIPYWNMMVRLSFFVLLVYLIVPLKRRLDLEEALARTDPLTGLANRRRFFELAEAEIERSSRYGHAVTFAYIDLDNFKGVNDRLGHEAGDAVLAVVAETIRDNLRKSDVAARLGGDEFALMLPETGPDAARAALEKLRSVVSEQMQQGNWPVTLSVGARTFSKPGRRVEDIIREIDDLMYSAKSEGKNTMRFEAST